MEIILLCILGLVQGLCEFLPISSSGHIVLLSKIFNIEDSLFVSIILHVATLLAVLLVFRKDILYMIKNPFSSQTMNVIFATIPTCIIALLAMPLINSSFSGSYLAVSFLISSVLLFVSERKCQKNYLFSNATFSTKNAVIMGISQGLAIFPGISRSGATICAGLLSRGRKEDCAKFSFIMSIPIIIMSLIMEIGKIVINKESISVNIFGLSLAFVIAFIVGIMSIKIMLKATQKLNFKWFSIYLLLMFVLSLFLLK